LLHDRRLSCRLDSYVREREDGSDAQQQREQQKPGVTAAPGRPAGGPLLCMESRDGPRPRNLSVVILLSRWEGMLSAAHYAVTDGVISKICLLSSNCSTSLYVGSYFHRVYDIPPGYHVRLSEQLTADCFALFARSILRSPC